MKRLLLPIIIQVKHLYEEIASPDYLIQVKHLYEEIASPDCIGIAMTDFTKAGVGFMAAPPP